MANSKDNENLNLDSSLEINDVSSKENSDQKPETHKKNNDQASFADSAAGAKLSGHYNVAAGKVKKAFGELLDDKDLKKEGRDQELKGKIHKFVGSLRGVREQAIDRFKTTRKETKQICKKHGARLLDVATDFVEDMKKALLK